eukprot:scaffold1360_cov251-Prasinococcus_capsulatus_cf.AAC.3
MSKLSQSSGSMATHTLPVEPWEGVGEEDLIRRPRELVRHLPLLSLGRLLHHVLERFPLLRSSIVRSNPSQSVLHLVACLGVRDHAKHLSQVLRGLQQAKLGQNLLHPVPVQDP